MSSFAQCSATDCEHHDGGGCLCYTVDLVPRNGVVICVDYDPRNDKYYQTHRCEKCGLVKANCSQYSKDEWYCEQCWLDLDLG